MNGHKVFMAELELRSLVPSFSLLSTKGEKIDLWNYKQRSNLLLYFSDVSFERNGKLIKFVQNYPRFKELNCELVAVLSGDEGLAMELVVSEKIPFPVCADPGGEVSLKYTDPSSHAIIIIDRYGALYSQFHKVHVRDLPSIETLLSEIEYIEVQCPECGFASELETKV